MRTERIKTDVLIIGGGTAGCFAAYVIGQKSNKKVLIAEKANIKRSGCLAAGVNALNAYITEGRVPQDYVDYAKKDAHGIVREDLLLTMSERLNHVTKVMEDLGLVILKDDIGLIGKFRNVAQVFIRGIGYVQTAAGERDAAEKQQEETLLK